ncbi:MAG: S1 RNA-binding domain-containing protein [Candidatus Micrarchaeaceae archaeon]|jgi:translation initiation factor 2 alpha subunit (eIF-2alpha)|nr:S1 RNA-binding domain-containing protein [Candidatus Micrarchaeota archaeon]
MEQQNIPKVGELVIANVSKISKFGAYCRLPEYNELEVFLPIREVSSGWIKNIREYIHEGQKLVCTVMFYDKEKATIDISLKRVSPNASKEKTRSYNLEKRLTALFQQAIKMSKEQPNKEALIRTALSEFTTYTNLVQNATQDTKEFTESKLPKKLKEAILKVLEANKKQKRYIVSYIATLYTYNTHSGAEELRSLMTAIKGEGVAVSYIGAPKYRFMAEGTDYSDAEEKIKNVETLIKDKLAKGVFEIEKEKLRKEKEDIISTISV